MLQINIIIALIVFVTVITITGNEELIVGVPEELTCVIKEENIRSIEWISQIEGDNTTLAVKSDINQLILTVNASEETTGKWFTCRAFTYSGYQFQKRVLLTARGQLCNVVMTIYLKK